MARWSMTTRRMPAPSAVARVAITSIVADQTPSLAVVAGRVRGIRGKWVTASFTRRFVHSVLVNGTKPQNSLYRARR